MLTDYAAPPGAPAAKPERPADTPPAQLLRTHGFHIVSRPTGRPPTRTRNGRAYHLLDAVALAMREDRARTQP